MRCAALKQRYLIKSVRHWSFGRLFHSITVNALIDLPPKKWTGLSCF